ncbi:hypothetical protein C8R45DRAFT_936313 [Mycena sanguinolenta]|nr:hypothetical protein C8R45DRAFT_936313 [Mycena sanguinolenta]
MPSGQIPLCTARMVSERIMRLVSTALLDPNTAFNAPHYRMDDRLMVEVALADASLWAALERKLRGEALQPTLRSVPLTFAKEPPGPDCLPIQRLLRELHRLLPAGLDIRDLCTLSVTGALFRRECHLIVRARIERAFAEFDLDADAVRFMLTQADAILAGWFVYHLSHMDFGKLQSVKTIDLYVRKGADAKVISRFIKIATVYKKLRIYNTRSARTFRNPAHENKHSTLMGIRRVKMPPGTLAASQHTPADLDYFDSLSARQLMEFRNHLFHPRYIETNAAKFLDNAWINITLLREFLGHPPDASTTRDSKHSPADQEYLDGLSARRLMDFRNDVFNPKYIEMNATKFLDHQWININLLKDYFEHASRPLHATSTLDPIRVKIEASLLTIKSEPQAVTIPRGAGDIKLRAIAKDFYEILSDSDSESETGSDLEVIEALQRGSRSSSAVPFLSGSDSYPDLYLQSSPSTILPGDSNEGPERKEPTDTPPRTPLAAEQPTSVASRAPRFRRRDEVDPSNILTSTRTRAPSHRKRTAEGDVSIWEQKRKKADKADYDFNFSEWSLGVGNVLLVYSKD